jgi:hypothetical protein
LSCPPGGVKIAFHNNPIAMRYIHLSVTVLLFTVIFQSCKKDDADLPPDNNLPVYKYLLRTIEWDNGARATVFYNNDSTIQSIAYANQSASDALNFTWSGKKLVNLSYASSLYKNTFNYDNGSLVSVVNSYKDISSPNGYKLEYSYGTNGNLATLRYFTINEAGTKLVTTSTYDYKANGDLQFITTTQTNNVKIKYNIESYSAVCEFNPWTFISASLSEYYQLYNYPVLSKLKKLPAKITKTIQQPGMPDRVDQVNESVYTITSERLDKIVTTLSYPDHPELNQSQSSIFRY